MFNYASWACGATLTGAELILSGGYHHARAEIASGFCYLYDLVLACMRFLNIGKRVLYLDIDVHNGDGVQEAFYAGNQVMAISLHESGKTLWPGIGFENETGDGAGKGFTVNVPLPIGICDAAYLEVFTKFVIPLLNWVMASLTVPPAPVIILTPACRNTLIAFGQQWPVIKRLGISIIY